MGRSRKQEPIGAEYLEFGNRLKSIREAHGMTQADLSRELEISKTSVVNYETGTRKVPLSVVKRISTFFHVSVDHLLGIQDYKDGRFGPNIERWSKEIGVQNFNEEEMNEIISFANYLIYKRRK